MKIKLTTEQTITRFTEYEIDLTQEQLEKIENAFVGRKLENGITLTPEVKDVEELADFLLYNFNLETIYDEESEWDDEKISDDGESNVDELYNILTNKLKTQSV